MPHRPSHKRHVGAYGAKMHKVMHEFKEGSLQSGSGQKVTSRAQAIAIGLSEARRRRATRRYKP